MARRPRLVGLHDPLHGASQHNGRVAGQIIRE